MISNSKLIEYVNLATEQQHPDPQRAVLGRANQSKMDENFSKDGKIGLFGISERKATELGLSREELFNPDVNFNAMMALDSKGYASALERGSSDDWLDMYAYTSGVTGGKEPKSKYLQHIQDSYDELIGTNGSNLIYDDGQLVDIQSNKVEEIEFLDEAQGDIENQIKFVASNLKNNITNNNDTLNTRAGIEDNLRQTLQLSYEVALEMTKKYQRKD